jgi:hypothetical protein
MLIIECFVFIAFKRDLPLFHDIDSVSQLRYLRNILFNQQDGFTLFVDLLDMEKISCRKLG